MEMTAKDRAELRNRLRRALLTYETLEHEHAKQGYELDRVTRECDRLKKRLANAIVLEAEEADYLLRCLPALKGRPTTLRRDVEDKLLDARLSSQ